MGIIEVLIARANTAIVTKSGDDGLAFIGGNPFKTINGAITAINASNAQGVTILVFPGVYDETISIPAGNSLRGISGSTVRISKQNVTSDTTLITMSENTTMEDVSLLLSSIQHVHLVGVAFPGVSTESAKLKGVTIEVDNSLASAAGTSNVYGVHSFGTGNPTISTDNVNDSIIITKSAGLGTKRSILSDTNPHTFNCRNNILLTTSAGGAGSYIAAEVNQVGALLNLRGSSAQGQTADISQTAGRLNIGSTNLQNANANNLGFSTDEQPAILIWAQPGVIAVGTSFYRPGTASLSTTEVFIRLSQKAVIKSLNVRSLIGPGIGLTSTWTIRKNGLDTPLTVSMTGTQTSNINEDVSVNFEAGDSISLKVTISLLSTTTDTVVQVEII